MAYPTDCKYTKDHEWIQAQGRTGLVGLTEHAQKQLGDIVFVEMPKVGDKFDAGDPFGTVESVKAVSELYMPVAGKVVETNGQLDEAPEDINDDAHHTWIIKIEMSNAKDLDGLLTADQYQAYIVAEE
ncbi:glycine cleavage system H protein [Kitasatospora sp. MAP12-15]|uniref:glycine cleavage system protein GcvH n=1 Tax=unclassified Kitasatospora TaxID=2633591 RepID=UPI0024767F89|nr:glycine cleavage system protein GcvH [Kitasatospora sp. MAP12-44]MDH6108490.1 glycine cleavage system H protein [Kitasatospora sp. MAP12-44]